MSLHAVLPLIFSFTMFSVVESLSTILGDPVGVWEWTFNNPDGTVMEGTMTVTLEGNEHEIVLAGESGEFPLKEAKMAGSELTHGYIYFEGMRIDFKGSFEENEFKGSITVDYNEFPFNATRKQD